MGFPVPVQLTILKKHYVVCQCNTSVVNTNASFLFSPTCNVMSYVRLCAYYKQTRQLIRTYKWIHLSWLGLWSKTTRLTTQPTATSSKCNNTWLASQLGVCPQIIMIQSCHGQLKASRRVSRQSWLSAKGCFPETLESTEGWGEAAGGQTWKKNKQKTC